MFERGGKVLVVMALVLTTGLHWAALQTVAWTTMLANHLCDDSFAQAVSKTFDGLHPCCLCKAIAAAKKSEKKSEALATTLKMEFPPATEKYVLISPKAATAFSWADLSATPLFSEPPVPPPRGFFV